MTLDENSVSRDHGELRQVRGRLFYKDNNSSNGSRVRHHDGVRVDLGITRPEREVYVGDILQLGEVDLLVVQFDSEILSDDALSDQTVGVDVQELPLPLNRDGLPPADREILNTFRHLPHFHPTDLQEAVESLAIQVTRSLEHATCSAVILLNEKSIGNDDIAFSDIEYMGVHRPQQQLVDGVPPISMSVLRKVHQRRAASCFTTRQSLPHTESVAGVGMNSCLCVPLEDDRGVIGFIQVHNDASALGLGPRELELVKVFAGIATVLLRQVKAARHQARLQTFASVGQVVAGMSHDAKNILLSLGAFMNSVERDFPELDASHKWHNVREDIDFLGFLVQDTWSRIGTGNRTPRKQEIPLAQLVDEMVTRCVRYFLQESQQDWVDLENHIPSDLVVRLDRDLLSVALFNGIKNSLDAYRLTEGKTFEKAKLQVFAHADNSDEQGSVHLTIVDDAGGIPPTVRDQLGTELVSTKREMGSGLGIRIMLGAIARMGGTTRLATDTDCDRQPAGTCLTFQLPVELPAELPHDEHAPLELVDDYLQYRQRICDPA